MADALTSGLKTYGEIRTKIGVFVAVLFAIIFYIIGGIILAKKDTHTVKASAILSDVSCTSNGCSATATYNVSGAAAPSPSSYTLNGNWPPNSKNGQSVTVYYDPKNPADVVQGINKFIGWILIGVATFILLFSLLFLKFFSSLSNQGKAVVGGFQAVGNISSFFGRN